MKSAPSRKSLTERSFDTVASLVRKIVRPNAKSSQPHPAVEDFIARNRRKYPDLIAKSDGPVLLVGSCSFYPKVYLFSLIAPMLARKLGARIESFGFGAEKFGEAERIFESFGARSGLRDEDLSAHDEEGRSLARKLFRGLASKRELRDLAVDGVLLGDVVYDTYLRSTVSATVDITDPRLEGIIFSEVRQYLMARDYFDRNRVVGVLESTGRSSHGPLLRVAMARDIPVFVTPYMRQQKPGKQLFYLIRLDPALAVGMRNDSKKHPYYRYREIFATLPPERQEAGRREAARRLGWRLNGNIDPAVLGHHSAYTPGSGQRILKPTDKPKVLILLHDYCDGVHVFRRMLFDDYYEWSRFLLARANETSEFEWYAKPHPNSLLAEEKNVLNRGVEAEFARLFPNVTFLDSSVSNRQMVDEGLAAAFTVHGTAGHEMAYLGVPVVNAGDNLHVAYDFNLHPRTVQEFVNLIDNAGRLPLQIDRRQIEEFFYMHYIYFNEERACGVEPIDPALHTRSDFVKRGKNPAILADMMRWESPERLTGIAEYLDSYLPAK